VGKSIGCAGSVLATLLLGAAVLLLAMAGCGILGGIIARPQVVPPDLRPAMERWLRGEPPDHPAVLVWREAASARVPLLPGCVPEGFPVSGGYFTQFFGPGHPGVDIGIPVGTPVRAPIGGTVIWAGWEDSGYGILVIVANGPIRAYLAHLSAVAVTVGQTVAAGEVVGLSGNTGRSTGPHLHYELRVDGVPVDPLAASGVSREACARAAAGGEGGGTAAEIPAAWRLPPGWRGMALAGAVDREAARGLLAPDEVGVRTDGPVPLFVWPEERPDLARQGAAAVRGTARIAVGPSPGEAWAVLEIPPGSIALVSLWKEAEGGSPR